MLKKILAISGRPGLYRLSSQGRNMLIVESLSDGKRMPVYARDKVISLGDVSIYTSDGADDTSLADVYQSIIKLTDGKAVDIKKLEKEGKLREFFGQALPGYDDDRVNTSDIRKALQWFNLLIAAGITDFAEAEQQSEPAAAEEVKEQPQEPKEEAKPKAKKAAK